MNNPDLKPCPFCGSDLLFIFSVKKVGCKTRFIEIICGDCLSSISVPWRDNTPIRHVRGEKDRREAIEKRNAAALWNEIMRGGGR